MNKMTIRTFAMYFVDGKPYGYEIDEKPYPRSLAGYDKSYLFIGKSASFCVVSNDGAVNRAVALSFATAIASNRFRTISIDLNEINGR